MKLSVTDLLNYYRCPRLLFLNHYGDKSLQLPPGDFLKRLWKVGRDYEAKVTDFFYYKKPKYRIGDHEQGFKATIEFMKEGVEVIYQGVLKNDELLGIPDFLMKARGNSVFGDYYYYAVDIKGASTSKDRYLFQLASYSYLLGDIQGFTPLYGALLLLDLDFQIKYFPALMKQVIEVIEETRKILSNPDVMPDLFIDSGCQMCQWYNFCLPESKEREHLSLVSGINRKMKESLETIPIKSYSELADCTTSDILQIEDLTGIKGENIILQAKSLKENRIYLKSMPEIEEGKKETYIDFESDMVFDEKGTELTRVDYLVGLLEYNNFNETYSYLLLEDSEEYLRKELEKFLLEHIDYTFYHYGHYEQTIFNGKWDILPKVKLINIEKIIKDNLILPVYSYSLKNIARFLGFRWKNKVATATQSMCWYTSYLESKDKKFLELSIEYNRDDCYALLYIKNWLLSLKQKNIPAKEFIDITNFSYK